MALRNLKPTTSSQRGVVLVDKKKLWTGSPYKPLCKGMKKTGGRNSHGHMCVRYRGGGAKKVYRIIDFERKKYDIEGIVQRIEYDPNRNAFIALIKYSDEVMNYILCPESLKVGDSVLAGEKVDIKVGNSSKLKNLPVGTVVHNIGLVPGKGGVIARAAGASVRIISHDSPYTTIKMNSKETRLVHEECTATIGVVSNQDHKNICLGKAGRSRWTGRKSHVRGVAMNPVDHPLGGRTSGGKHPVSPWGLKSKGKKTRKNKRTNFYIVKAK